MNRLPDDCIFAVLKHLSYDDVSKLRAVDKHFNFLSGQALNDGFKKVKGFHAKVIKEVKAALPRRESERRKHPLYPRRDILQAIETRLSLLTMTYSRYIADGSVCFIPGKVLDELFRLLRRVHCYDDPLLHQSVPMLQELRDISSMAMEHFDENIVPFLERNEPTVTPTFTPFITKPLERVLCPLVSTASSSSTKLQRTTGTARLRNKVWALERKNRNLENQVSTLNTTVNEQKGQLVDLEKQICYIQSHLGVEFRKTGASGSLNQRTTQDDCAEASNAQPEEFCEFLDLVCGVSPASEGNSPEGAEKLSKRRLSRVSDLDSKRPKL